MRARSCLGSAHAGSADRAIHQEKAYGDGEAALNDAADNNAALMTGTERTAEATYATGRTNVIKLATVHTAAEAASPNSGVAEMAAAEIEGGQSAAAVETAGTNPLGKSLVGTAQTQNLHLGSSAPNVVQAPQLLLQQLFRVFCGTRFTVMFDIHSAIMAHLKSALLRYLLVIDFSSSGQAGLSIFPFVLRWFYRRACTGHDSDTVRKVLCEMHTRVGKLRSDSVRTPSSLSNPKRGKFQLIRIK